MLINCLASLLHELINVFYNFATNLDGRLTITTNCVKVKTLLDNLNKSSHSKKHFFTRFCRHFWDWLQQKISGFQFNLNFDFHKYLKSTVRYKKTATRTFLSGFKIVYDKMAVICPDFKSYSKSRPFTNQSGFLIPTVLRIKFNCSSESKIKVLLAAMKT